MFIAQNMTLYFFRQSDPNVLLRWFLNYKNFIIFNFSETLLYDRNVYVCVYTHTYILIL